VPRSCEPRFSLVTERGTAAVSLSDIAEAADVSRRVVYQHFGDRDTLLLEAGLDLARRELLPYLADNPQTSGRWRCRGTSPYTGCSTARC